MLRWLSVVSKPSIPDVGEKGNQTELWFCVTQISASIFVVVFVVVVVSFCA